MKNIIYISIIFITGFITLAPSCSKTPEHYFDAGKRMYEKEEYIKAYRLYTRAIKLNPSFDEAYWERAITGIKIDSAERSIDDFTSYIELQSKAEKLYKAYFQRANLMFKRGYKSDACFDWETACNLNQGNAPCDAYRINCK